METIYLKTLASEFETKFLRKDDSVDSFVHDESRHHVSYQFTPKGYNPDTCWVEIEFHIADKDNFCDFRFAFIIQDNLIYQKFECLSISKEYIEDTLDRVLYIAQKIAPNYHQPPEHLWA